MHEKTDTLAIEYQRFNFIGKIQRGKTLSIVVHNKWSN